MGWGPWITPVQAERVNWYGGDSGADSGSTVREVDATTTDPGAVPGLEASTYASALAGPPTGSSTWTGQSFGVHTFHNTPVFFFQHDYNVRCLVGHLGYAYAINDTSSPYSGARIDRFPIPPEVLADPAIIDYEYETGVAATIARADLEIYGFGNIVDPAVNGSAMPANTDMGDGDVINLYAATKAEYDAATANGTTGPWFPNWSMPLIGSFASNSVTPSLGADFDASVPALLTIPHVEGYLGTTTEALLGTMPWFGLAVQTERVVSGAAPTWYPASFGDSIMEYYVRARLRLWIQYPNYRLDYAGYAMPTPNYIAKPGGVAPQYYSYGPVAATSAGRNVTRGTLAVAPNG